MVGAIDLAGPLQEFLDRTQQIRAVPAMVEAVTRDSAAIVSTRAAVQFPSVPRSVMNTANSMSVVFLASSFEEFVREEIREAARYLGQQYASVPADTKLTARNGYWSVFLDKVRRANTIVTNKPSFAIDVAKFAEVRVLVDGAAGFVVSDDPATIDVGMFSHHANNFRPHVVDQIAARIGIKSLIRDSADYAGVKAHFGVTKKNDSYELLVAKLDTFYRLRNTIVHSTSVAQGVGIELLYEYIELFEALADGIRGSLAKHVAAW